MVIALPLSAQARPDVRKMTCSQAQAMVQQQGYVVFTFTDNTYDKVVSSIRYCDPSDNALQRVIVSTSDRNRCHIGGKCVYDDLFFRKKSRF